MESKAVNTQHTETPVEFIRETEKLLGIRFRYDMAASAMNNKAPVWCGEDVDSLTVNWAVPADDTEWTWLNPPFRDITKWCNKCEEQSRLGVKIVSIWPLSSDLNVVSAWQNANVYIIHGRVWNLVRGLMMCVWGQEFKEPVKGLRWDKKTKTLTRIW